MIECPEPTLNEELTQAWVYDRKGTSNYYYLFSRDGGFVFYPDASPSAVFQVDPTWEIYESPVIRVYVVWRDEYRIRVIMQDPNAFFLSPLLFGGIGTIWVENGRAEWGRSAVNLPDQRAQYIYELIQKRTEDSA